MGSCATPAREVIVGTTAAHDDPDAIYAYDPVLMTDEGAILLRPGKEGRRGEPGRRREGPGGRRDPGRRRDGRAGVRRGRRPVLARSADAARRHRVPHDGGGGGGPPRSAAGRGRRGVRPAPPRGAGGVHPSALVPVVPRPRTSSWPRSRTSPCASSSCSGRGTSRSWRCPTTSSTRWAPTSWRSRRAIALALEGNPETRRRMEAAGVEVRTYAGDEISRKGDGGPTCLTRPLRRG